MRSPMVSVSQRMRAVRRENTSPELLLQHSLTQRRFRFKTHDAVRGCYPDIVFPAARVAVFVDGDFWHGRLLVESGAGALQQSFGAKSRLFWIPKIMRNVARDRSQTLRLRRGGWSVIRLWEREILRNPSAAAALVAKRVRDRKRRSRIASAAGCCAR